MQLLEKVTDVAGQALGSAFRMVGTLRSGPKALHPRGQICQATLTITGGAPLGVPLLDEPGEHACRVRLSRATGVPAPLPDVLGLALRLPEGDLLFASTGRGRVGRHLLVPRRSHRDGPLGTLLPLKSPHGAVELALDPTPSGGYTVLVATPGGPWEERGRLDVGLPGPDDPSLRFDPVGRTPAGLRQYDAVSRLRAPSYRRRG